MVKMKQHKGNQQPKCTTGKMVTYKTADVFGEKNERIPGHWHLPHLADELNWKTSGLGSALIGAIEYYAIL